MKKTYMARKLMMLCSLFGVSSAEENVTPLLVPDAVVSADGNITLNKWAERIGPDEWKVTVTADVKAIEVEPPKLEVVFVLDASNSMRECADEEAHKKGLEEGRHSHVEGVCPLICTNPNHTSYIFHNDSCWAAVFTTLLTARIHNAMTIRFGSRWKPGLALQ